jgi:hypothetical protein
MIAMEYSKNYVFILIIIAIVILAAFLLYAFNKPAAIVTGDNHSSFVCKEGQNCSLQGTPDFFKENLTVAQKKLSTDLLMLTDSRYLPIGMTPDALELQMEQNHQLTYVAETGDTLVYVYIKTSDNTDTTAINSLVWNVTNTDSANHLVVAWMNVNNLTTVASLDFVQSIKSVISPDTWGDKKL